MPKGLIHGMWTPKTSDLSPLGMIAVGFSNSPYIAIYSSFDFSQIDGPASGDLPTGAVSYLCFSNNGNYLALGASKAGGNYEHIVYDTSDWSVLDRFTYTTTSRTRGLRFSYDDSLLYRQTTNSGLKVYNTTTWTQDNTISGVTSNDDFAFNPMHTKMITNGETSDYIHIWDLASETLDATGDRPYWSGITGPYSVDWHGNKVAVAAFDGWKIYSSLDWSVIHSEDNSDEFHFWIEFNEDGTKLYVYHYVYSSGAEGIKVFETDTWTQVDEVATSIDLSTYTEARHFGLNSRGDLLVNARHYGTPPVRQASDLDTTEASLYTSGYNYSAAIQNKARQSTSSVESEMSFDLAITYAQHNGYYDPDDFPYPRYYWSWYSKTNLMIDGKGNRHVIHIDPFEWGSYIFYYTDESGSWVVTELATTCEDFNGDSCMDSSDNIHLLWVEDGTGTNQLRYTTNASGSWVNEEFSDSYRVNSMMWIQTDEKNKVHIIFNDVATGNALYINNVSGSWSSPEVVKAGGISEWSNASFAVFSTGATQEVICASKDGTNGEYIIRGAGTWATTGSLDASTSPNEVNVIPTNLGAEIYWNTNAGVQRRKYTASTNTVEAQESNINGLGADYGLSVSYRFGPTVTVDAHGVRYLSCQEDYGEPACCSVSKDGENWTNYFFPKMGTYQYAYWGPIFRCNSLWNPNKIYGLCFDLDYDCVWEMEYTIGES